MRVWQLHPKVQYQFRPAHRRRWVRFLLAALVLVLAGWGAAAKSLFGLPACEPVVVLSGTQGEGHIYQCGGCAFVVLNDNHAMLLGCEYGKQRIGGKEFNWSLP